jgi:hypothetical protein
MKSPEYAELKNEPTDYEPTHEDADDSIPF